MGTCFVIQPFDKGVFDKRYDDVFAPAIIAAGLEPYRVDRDPSSNILIEDIEKGILNADVCLAEITTDNPNIWYELGYAIASGKDVVLLCSSERKSRFPFDIQHRKVITYTNESPRDFQDLKIQITDRIKAILKKQLDIGHISKMSPIVDTEGLSQHEMVALVMVAENMESPNNFVSVYTIRQDMMKAGFTKIAITLALKSLLDKQLLELSEESDYNGNPYIVYGVTDKGMNWLFKNEDKLVLRKQQQNNNDEGIDLDNLPF